MRGFKVVFKNCFKKLNCVTCAIIAITCAHFSSISYASSILVNPFSTLNRNTKNQDLVAKAQAALQQTLSKKDGSFFGNVSQALFKTKQIAPSRFVTKQVVTNGGTSTVKFTQYAEDVEVLGGESMVHFNSSGDVHDVSERQINLVQTSKPSLQVQDIQNLVADRYNGKAVLEKRPQLKVMRSFNGQAKLVYQVQTKTTVGHLGQNLIIDAHSGKYIMEADRTYDLNHHHSEQELSAQIAKAVSGIGKHVAGVRKKVGSNNWDLKGESAIRGLRTVYNASTERSSIYNDEDGYPIDINFEWYDKAIEDGQAYEGVDRSAINAYRGTGKVYAYFDRVHGRKSFDGKDSRVLSAVHMGRNMNNAFWASELSLMAFGDGDGELFTDLTYGVDVTGHEISHGLTDATAQLIYAAEPGALNESYSDFFGRMVDYEEGEWDIGARIMAQKSGRRALRNMKNPEEFRQPGSTQSSLRVPTTEVCFQGNDRCGVHTNSGIPNRAASLIVEGIGKFKTEKIYFNVLTRRLTSTSNFRDARVETIKECKLQLGDQSEECRIVEAAFDTVGMI